LSRSCEVQASGDVSAALAFVEHGLGSYPDEGRLLQRKEALLKIIGPARQPQPKEEVKAPLRKPNELRDANAAVEGRPVATPDPYKTVPDMPSEIAVNIPHKRPARSKERVQSRMAIIKTVWPKQWAIVAIPIFIFLLAPLVYKTWYGKTQ